MENKSDDSWIDGAEENKNELNEGEVRDSWCGVKNPNEKLEASVPNKEAILAMNAHKKSNLVLQRDAIMQKMKIDDEKMSK
jgi:hypothetical protein